MGINGVPPRWEEYSKVGKLIPETKIIAFKVPLREEICRNLSDSKLKFTVDDLVSELRDIKLTLVVDLTMTTRFYNKKDLEKYGIKHEKMFIRGGGSMPKEADVKKFCEIISDHFKDNCDGIIGVHCTHGLNRTGYFICRYMIDCLGIMGSTSVHLFEKARGHRFDRENYREFLKTRSPYNLTEEGYSPEKGNISRRDSSLFSHSSKKSVNTEHNDWRNDHERTYLNSQKSYKIPHYGRSGYCDTRNGHRGSPENQEFHNASSSSSSTSTSSSSSETSFNNKNFSNYRSYKLSKEQGSVNSQPENRRKSDGTRNRNYKSDKYS